MIQTNRLVFIRLISLMVLSEVTAKSICNGSPKCGYTKKEGLGYYKIYTNAKTWNEARQSCLQDGAHLAIFNSEMERMHLLKMINEEKKNIIGTDEKQDAYIGVHDLYEEGEWVTVFGKLFSKTGYNLKGAKTASDLGKNLSCVALTTKDIFSITVHDCKVKLAYICERPLNCEQFRSNLVTS